MIYHFPLCTNILGYQFLVSMYNYEQCSMYVSMRLHFVMHFNTPLFPAHYTMQPVSIQDVALPLHFSLPMYH